VACEHAWDRDTILVHFLGGCHWKYRGMMEMHYDMINE